MLRKKCQENTVNMFIPLKPTKWMCNYAMEIGYSSVITILQAVFLTVAVLCIYNIILVPFREPSSSVAVAVF